jgi:azurin
MNRKTLAVALVAGAMFLTPVRSFAADDEKPTLNLGGSARVVDFQLRKHTNAQLVAIDRNPDDAKFKPVYAAILKRKGIDRKYREEAVAALAKLDKSDPVTVILAAIGGVADDDKNTPRELAALLIAQKPETLAAKKADLTALAKDSPSPTVKAVALAALAAADGSADAAWKLATDAGEGGTKAILAAVPSMPAKVRGGVYDNVKALAEKAPDDATQALAMEALVSIPGKEADAFKLLAEAAEKGTGERQAAAIRAIGRIPASKWPADQVEPLANPIVELVKRTAADQRTSPAMAQAVQLGNDLAGALGAEKAAPIRKQLRDLAPRVVVIHTLTEQMMFDLNYFTVQAGKPVEVILDNSADTMPHNFVLVKPGQLTPMALKAGAMAQPDDPKVKAFIPEDPNVLQATHLVTPGETEALNFTAPDKPGNYPFFCSYPGHYVKMYGVMQVVEDLDAYDKKPVAPNDPQKFRTPYKSAKNEGAGEAGGHAHEH